MAERSRPGRVRQGLVTAAIAISAFLAVIVAVEVATDLWLSR